MASSQLNHLQSVYLAGIASELAAAPHGGKEAIVARAAQHLGLSTQSVHRLLKNSVGRETGRKRRADAGQRAVSDADLRMISAALLGTFRKTGNRIMTFDSAVEMLRSNGVIDTELSAGRLATILTEKGLHPSQLIRPEPSIEQRSLHPNHVWQVDASVCVAYYLSNAQGLQVMDEKKFYKNKPANVTRIQDERLIRYAAADHFEHELLARYYLGSECALHLTDFLIWAMRPKAGHIMHGVPLIVQMDMGSANTSEMTKNLLKHLGVRVIVHERHNSRANGSVEKAHHIIEREFESGLSFKRIADLADLNHKALIWANHFGATKIHSRYGKTRHALWLTITQEQLRLAPDEDLMRELVMTNPVERRVSNDLELSFAPKGHGQQTYDVRFVPGVMAGAKVPVVVNPFRMPSINVGYTDTETGEILWMTVAPLERGEDGRRTDAPVIGEQLRAAPRGLLERNRDAVMHQAYGGTDSDMAALRKEKGGLVFEGRVDPFKQATEAELPAYMPKRGTDLAATARSVEAARLTVIEACKRIKAVMGREYSPEVYAWVSAKFENDGVPDDQVQAICDQFMAPKEQIADTQDGNVPRLRVVGGDV